MPRSRNLMAPTALLLVLAACASPPERGFDERRRAIEARIEGQGLAADPRVAAARNRLDASVAEGGASVLVDEVELRAEVLSEREEKARLLARVPFEHWGRVGAGREVGQAESELALAQLDEISLEQRTRDCRPSLEWRVYTEQEELYARHATRLRALLRHNDRRQAIGVADETRAIELSLAGAVALARREPALPPAPEHPMLRALPELEAGLPALNDEKQVIGERIELHHPGIEVGRARTSRFEALAERERASRWPALRFVDFGVEPTTYAGETRQLSGRVSFEVPLGREARSRSRAYAARAESERNLVRAELLERTREVGEALARLNQFRLRAPALLEISERADRAEEVADRWLEQGGVRPDRIEGLLDEVHDARNLVLDARAEAGRAACTLLEQAGVGVDRWPTR